MTAQRPDVDKLRKIDAVKADPSASPGEKAAAGAAATRIRTRHAADARTAIEANGLMYLLGRAWSRARRERGSAPAADPGIMYAFARAWRRMIAKR